MKVLRLPNVLFSRRASGSTHGQLKTKTNFGKLRRVPSERSEGRLDAVLGASFSMISQLRIIGIIAWPPESSSENPQYS